MYSINNAQQKSREMNTAFFVSAEGSLETALRQGGWRSLDQVHSRSLQPQLTRFLHGITSAGSVHKTCCRAVNRAL